MMQRFWQGETIRVRVQFADFDGEPMGALGVAFQARAEGGPVVTGEAIPEGALGAFYADFLLDAPGVWSLRVSCTGPTSAVSESQVRAIASLVLSP